MQRINLVLFMVIVFVQGCNNPDSYNKNLSEKELNSKKLEFRLKINKENYLNTIFGESPQIAIWLEEIETESLKNVYVTYRSGKNDWVGKVYCKVALPFWESRLRAKSSIENQFASDIEAVSSATSKNDIVNAMIYLDENSKWKYFIEVNVSGDYNNTFKSVLKNGVPDYEGNGQPSIVYSGYIDIKSEEVSSPEVIGRTHQISIRDSLFTDIYNITTAMKMLEKIEIKVY